ncbi:MAG: aminotransferase class I/II-fold pyridoxal phosphate-dependent enzyme, partial [Bacteroidota bacterium]
QAANRLAHIQEYYFARKLRELRQRMAAGEDIINLGIGNPDMNPSEETLKRLVKAVVEPGVHGYQPYKGVPALRNAYAEWYLNTYGVSLDAEHEILPLIGSKEGIMHISQAFLNEGDEVLVPNPGYPTYTSVSRLTGANIREYVLSADNDWYPDLEALGQTDLSKVKLMWVNYPHMPTGALPTEALFADLIAFGKKHQILICHDNPYSLVLNPRPMSILSVPGAKEVAVELNSLSKSHNMAGWRMGVVVGREDYVQTILRVKSNMDSGMFAPLQQAAVTALNNPYDWHRLRNEEYARRKEIATAILDQLDCGYSDQQGGMFIWAEIPAEAESGEAFSEKILNECQVFLTPGFIFGSGGDRYIRISLCTPPSRLAEALRRIREISLQINLS